MKFKVGDVVTYNNGAGRLILEYAKRLKGRVKFDCKGIIVTFHEDVLDIGEFYTVFWFGRNGKSINEVLELNLCRGNGNKNLCNRCRYRVECGTRRRH